jgi:ribonuclease D
LFVDTEFHRESTFYPILALIQVFDGNQCYLIEPSAAQNSALFKSILRSSEITKVFHSASEDIEVIYRSLDCLISNLWDTQIAANYLLNQSSISYAKLIETTCDVTIAKGQARSDWLARPLSEQQIAYAVADVTHLASAFERLVEMNHDIPQLGSWITEDCLEVIKRVEQLDNVENNYQDLKNAWKLTKTQLVRLRALVVLREQLARVNDKPKSFILKDDVLFLLAQQGLKEDMLPDIERWHPASRRRYGKAVIECLKTPLDDCNLGKLMSPKDWQKLTQPMQQASLVVTEAAHRLGILQDVLCSKKLLRGYVKYLLGFSTMPPRGWTASREAALGNELRLIFCDN